MNPILMTDAYKQTHHLQYPEDTKHVYSYLESRGGPNETVFFGLGYYLAKYLEGSIVTQEHIEQAREFHLGLFGHDRYFNEAGWQRIVDVHGGRIPLRISAVPEGMVVPSGNVLMTMVNTDPQLPWLTNHFETLLLKVWYPITVASRSWRIARSIEAFAAATGGTLSPFHLNDFGYRGVSSEESAEIGGMAHLLSFAGTDTLAGILAAQHYYGASPGVGMSVMASEHSTTTIYGREGEHDAMRSFIEKAGPGIVSLVSDSYDYFALVRGLIDNDAWRDALQRAAANGTRVVIRPDSGNPPEVVRETLRILERGTVERNEAGYKLLPEHLGIIYGDGINEESIQAICRVLIEEGWAVDGRNVVFGMGGGLLQQLDRDTHQFAIKCSAAQRGDEWVPVQKQPKTDGGKSSKAGRLKLIQIHDELITVPSDHPEATLLEPVFVDGHRVNAPHWDEVRNRVNESSLAVQGT